MTAKETKDAVQGDDAKEACPYRMMPREAGAGHWRDWHRGHGCNQDPERTCATTSGLIVKTPPPPEPPVHVIDQTGQPYGSERRCCNRCGAMAVPGMQYVESTEEWWALPNDQRCLTI